MIKVKEDLRKRYEKHSMLSEIYLWQLHIIENPDDRECYQNAIADNLKKIKGLDI